MLLDYLPLQEPEVVVAQIAFEARTAFVFAAVVIDGVPPEPPAPGGNGRPRLTPRAAPPVTVVRATLRLAAVADLTIAAAVVPVVGAAMRTTVRPGFKFRALVDTAVPARKAVEDELVLIGAL